MKATFLATLLLLLPASWAAPKDGKARPEEMRKDPAILNPFLHPGKESLGVLQGYLMKVGQVDKDAGAMTREQALLLLFALHDYDKSGRLDGLEVMRLLSELASHQADGQPVPDMVVQVVDSILQTQDFDQDGLLEPSEMLLGPQRGRAPSLLAAASGEEGAVLRGPPGPDGQAAGLPGPLQQQSTAEPPAAPELLQERGVMEAPSLSPPEQKQEWRPGWEEPASPQEGGGGAGVPPALGD